MPTGTLTVVNGTSGYLDAVVFSECDAFTYGFNRLSKGDAIPPGEARSFTVTAGCWDVGGGKYAGGEAYQRVAVPAGGIFELTLY
jgi:hypothetical protein